MVASANNRAGENITLGLPSLDKVSPQPLKCDDDLFDYFAATAESILNYDAAKKGGDGIYAPYKALHIDTTLNSQWSGIAPFFWCRFHLKTLLDAFIYWVRCAFENGLTKKNSVFKCNSGSYVHWKKPSVGFKWYCYWNEYQNPVDPLFSCQYSKLRHQCSVN